MSLRLRLFLLFGALVAILVLAQWWWVRVLTRDLSAELDEVASSIGRSVADFFVEREAGHEAAAECVGEDCEGLPEAAGGEPSKGAHRVKVMRFSTEDEKVKLGDGKVVLHRLRRGPRGEEAGSEEPDHRHAYAYEVEQVEVKEGSEEGAAESLETFVKIHVEHQDGARYLWMGGPTMSRRVQIPQRGLRDKLEGFQRRLVFGSIGLLALGLVLAAVVAHRVTTPLRRLSDAAREVGEGALGTQVPVRADGEVGEAIGAFNRMSGRLAELDARSRELEARKHLGEIGEIARGLAHTLRNPLNALGLSVEELAAGANDGAASRELAESARRQIRRLDHGIRSFLALASQSGGVPAEVDVGSLVEDVALEALQDSRGKVSLEVESQGDLPRLAAVEPELRAVLQALVVNAVEASPEGGRVKARAASPAPGRVRLEVEDEGEGLAPEVRRRLFEPHLSTKANGSGMGLFLAHRIATTRYAGTLELTDRQTGGTRAALEIGDRAPAEGEESDG